MTPRFNAGRGLSTPSYNASICASQTATTGLPRRMPSIYPQIRASHEGTGIADQEDRRASVLLRCGQSTKHILRRPISLPVGILLKESFHHCCNNVTRRNGVDTDSMSSPLHGEVACELDHTCLGCVVRWTDQALQDTS